MTIIQEAAAPTIDFETAAAARAANAEAALQHETPAISADEAAAIGAHAIREITVVSGHVAYLPRVPGQNQPFADWTRSTLYYDRIKVEADEDGNASDLLGYGTTHDTIRNAQNLDTAFL